jgi:hypothetical protein
MLDSVSFWDAEYKPLISYLGMNRCNKLILPQKIVSDRMEEDYGSQPLCQLMTSCFFSCLS